MDIIDIIIFALMGISGVANIALGYLTNRFGKKSVAIHANATFKETFFKDILSFIEKAEQTYSTPEEKERYVVLKVMEIIHAINKSTDIDISLTEDDITSIISTLVKFSKAVNYNEKKELDYGGTATTVTDTGTVSDNTGDDSGAVATENQGVERQSQRIGVAVCEDGSEPQGTSQNSKPVIY